MTHATRALRWQPAPAGTWHRRAFAAASAESYLCLAVMVSLALLLAMALGFRWDGRDLPIVVATLVFLALSAMMARGVGAGRFATAIEAPVLLLGATMATACLSLLFATGALPYQDALLDRADRIVMPFFRWRDMYLALQDHDVVVGIMSGIYRTLLWQPFVLAPLLAIVDERACWRFVRAWFLTLIACVAVFPFVPAIGPYLHYGLPPAGLPALGVDTAWRPVQVLDAVRDGSLRVLAPASMTGLISFPSFHAASATLMFWAFRRVPVIGPPMMALNVAMCLTAPLIGSHYFIDIPAGMLVALAALRMARRDARFG